MIRCKTATLFEAACEVGAMSGGADARGRVALRDYGRELGWAFQLVDDVLDYRGESGAMGKNTGDDLREGKMTLPVILALAEGTAAEREVIASALGRYRSAGRDGWQGAGDPREAPDAGADARQGARPYPDGAGCADGTAGVADAGDLVATWRSLRGCGRIRPLRRCVWPPPPPCFAWSPSPAMLAGEDSPTAPSGLDDGRGGDPVVGVQFTEIVGGLVGLGAAAEEAEDGGAGAGHAGEDAALALAHAWR